MLDEEYPPDNAPNQRSTNKYYNNMPIKTHALSSQKTKLLNIKIKRSSIHSSGNSPAITHHKTPLIKSKIWMMNPKTSLLFMVLAVLTWQWGVESTCPTISADMLSFLEEEENILKNKTIIDITHRIAAGLPQFYSQDPLGLQVYLKPSSSIKKGSDSNTATIMLPTHTGTHADAPGHFNQTLMDKGCDVASLDLKTLNGPVLVIDTPRDKNITAEVMKSLNIPRGVKSVLFRTLNTDRKLMSHSQFDGSYTAFTTDGALYLVENTDIKVVGIDYLSVAIGVYPDLAAVHNVLLSQEDIIPVEGLNLDEAVPGIYTLYCLPIRLVNGDGAPARCILIK